jgi:hypothetical protein
MEYCSEEEDNMNNLNIDYFQEVNDLCNNLQVPNNIYNYPGLNYLNTNIHNIFEEINIGDTVHICAYNIHSSCKIPYLQYFLYKQHEIKDPTIIHKFNFPNFIYNNQLDLLTKCITTIQILCSSFYKDPIFEMKGYLKYDDQYFIFYDCSNFIIDTLKMTKSNDLWLTVMDEIINYQNICGFEIESSVIDLFHSFYDLNYLINDKNIPYELPKIVYSVCENRKINFISTFGISVKNDLFGSYYYFTDYNSAIQQINTNEICGLIRCILFLGNIKYITNENSYDTSDIAKKIIEDNINKDYTSDKFIESKMLSKISDWDSQWILNYDSVYIGKYAFDNGSIFEKGPLWVVKNLNQYHILSCQQKKGSLDISYIM